MKNVAYTGLELAICGFGALLFYPQGHINSFENIAYTGVRTRDLWLKNSYVLLSGPQKLWKKNITYYEPFLIFGQFGSNGTIRIIKIVNLTNSKKKDQFHESSVILRKKVTTIVGLFTKSEAPTTKWLQ